MATKEEFDAALKLVHEYLTTLDTDNDDYPAYKNDWPGKDFSIDLLVDELAYRATHQPIFYRRKGYVPHYDMNALRQAIDDGKITKL